MKKRDSLERKLQDFCNVSPPYKFSLRLEDNNMKTRNIKPYIAVACAMLVFVCAVAFAVGFSKGFVPNEKTEDFGFVVNAYALGAQDDSATPDSVEISSTERTKINKEWAFIDKSYTENSKSLGFQHIAFEIVGDDVKSFDIKTEHGKLHFSDELNRLGADNVNKDGRVFDYFVAGYELYDLPADTEETYLFWIPECDRIDAVAPTIEEKCEILNTAEDYNKYFGDTITLTVEYKDGSKKSADIVISYDDDAYVYAEMSAVDTDITMY